MNYVELAKAKFRYAGFPVECEDGQHAAVRACDRTWIVQTFIDARRARAWLDACDWCSGRGKHFIYTLEDPEARVRFEELCDRIQATLWTQEEAYESAHSHEEHVADRVWAGMDPGALQALLGITAEEFEAVLNGTGLRQWENPGFEITRDGLALLNFKGRDRQCLIHGLWNYATRRSADMPKEKEPRERRVQKPERKKGGLEQVLEGDPF